MNHSTLREDWEFEVATWRVEIAEEYPSTRQWSIWHCRPYFYGQVVVPGQAYWACQRTPDHVSATGEPLWGITVPPSDDDLEEWAVELRSIYKDGNDPLGGWSPVRSSVCYWGGYRCDVPQQKHFYKAERASFDGGYFMLMHQYDLVVNGKSLRQKEISSGFMQMAERLGLYHEISQNLFYHEPRFQRSPYEQAYMRAWLSQSQQRDLDLLDGMRKECRSTCEAMDRQEMWAEVDVES